MTVSEKARYEAQIIRLRAVHGTMKPCRMDLEYADYLDRWLHSTGTVDGASYEMRMGNDNLRPMPYNVYWIE